jgi:hypothetical protein
MNIIEHQSKVLFQQHEANRQLASELASSARVLFQRLTALLAKMPRRVPGAYPF